MKFLSTILAGCYRILRILKHIKDDTFCRIRRDEILGEEVIFEIDDSGKVVRMWHHSKYRKKIR